MLQSVTPLLHGLGLLPHVFPDVHETHWPEPLQTWPAPHDAPAPTLRSSTHTVLPVVHDVLPETHGALGFDVHGWFGMHTPHEPPLSHIIPEPHGVPCALLLPSMHRSVPVLQSVIPFLQAALGLVVHAALAVHELHKPDALQTWFTPHGVPAARLPESMQT